MKKETTTTIRGDEKVTIGVGDYVWVKSESINNDFEFKAEVLDFEMVNGMLEKHPEFKIKFEGQIHFVNGDDIFSVDKK